VSKKLRSYDWFGKSDKMGFVHRSWLRNQGYPDDYFQGKPVIGICNTWSELTPCNGHLRDFAEIVKRGVVEAGGFPVEFPVTSLGETIMRPTTIPQPGCDGHRRNDPCKSNRRSGAIDRL
jgi:L-arabonate dehydrase